MIKLLEVIRNLYKINNEITHIRKVQMDSRKVQKGDIFFAINNGKNYIGEVLKKGVSLVISEDKKWENNSKVLVVENVIKSLQNIAKEYRKELPVKLIGIVGSNGKTTTKDILYSILSIKYNTKKTEGNYNNHIGVPFTILQINEKDNFGIIEMGMSNFGEIKKLCEIANLDYSIITNIGDSHLAFMKNRKNVFLEKSKVKDYVEESNLLFFGDDPYLKSLKGRKVGFNSYNEFRISDYNLEENGIFFKLNNEEYKSNIYGKHNCINTALSIGMSKIIGLTTQEIKKGLGKIEITPMRFQKILKDEITFINDSYNASPISMKYSLNTFEKFKTTKEKVVILADMGELGAREIDFHVEVIKYAINKDFLKVILYGDRMEKALQRIDDKKKIIFFRKKTDIKELISKEFKNKLILIKGSNFNQLWEIIE
ncbi:MAG: UDP-N-acetylmuramoyl-tripeptide--D-alanyl-D-alanine ligase [Fusobacterium sp. JB021]|nr:UDP-N-acetylmuramoyl-tripeptide--D-alanyl-D-alanine ligase [Fusobacterium sp. JB020]MDP0493083.1 UDP-N-acetylmuramoyl-tripeptide--D-alanyl-D-alanine ligase [Fusobacterium sp. JB021]MDP0507515.1 UDP-N-acetylmuramoyl-tripeptide--D-alanyl-D-alanine ligase [Fusobacterium sp. JB019]